MSTRSRSLSHVVVAASAVLGIGGAAFLASLPPDSVGRTQLKDDAVNSARVQDKTLTGKDIQSNTLGTVPKAKSAKAAKVADSARSPGLLTRPRTRRAAMSRRSSRQHRRPSPRSPCRRAPT